MSADVSRSHGSDGRGEDRPLHTMYPAVAWDALLTEDPPFRRGLSAGKESVTSLPQRRFPGDKSPGKRIPSDKSLGKPPECRWGKPLML
nr:hypothetical protein [Tanacetum cinerariifolium]